MVPLFDEFNLTKLEPYDTRYLPKTGEDVALNGLQNLLVSVMKILGTRDPAVAVKGFFEAMDRYMGMHRELFGTPPRTLPPRPDAKTLQYLQGTWEDFHTRNNLTVLYPFQTLLYSIYGYG